MNGLGLRLKRRRQEKGLTQEQVAARLSIHRTTYTKYEADRVEPSLDTLCQLAALLGCSVGFLLDEKSPRFETGG